MAIALLEKQNGSDTLKGDVVDTFEDGKWFPQNIYDSFDVLEVPGFTKAEFDAELRKKVPEQSRAWKSETTAWTMKPPEEIDLWKNTQNEWCFLRESPGLGYGVSLNGMTSGERETLESAEVDADLKKIVIASVAKETISRVEDNLDKVDMLIEV